MFFTISKKCLLIGVLLLTAVHVQSMSRLKKRKREGCHAIKVVLKNKTSDYLWMYLKTCDFSECSLFSLKTSGPVKKGEVCIFTISDTDKYILTLFSNGCEMYYKLRLRNSKSSHSVVLSFSPLSKDGSEDTYLETIRKHINSNTAFLAVDEKWFYDDSFELEDLFIS